MGHITLLLRVPWANVLLLLCAVVNLSNQTSPDGNEEALHEIKQLILSKFDDMNNEIKSQGIAIQEMATKLAAIDNQLQGMAIKEDLQLMKEDGLEEKTLLIFNPNELKLAASREANLNCGVIGVYDSCHWENSGIIYQLDELTYQTQSNVRAASSTSSIDNQCGITITKVNLSHDGVWTCKVLTNGQTLTASKTISVEKNELVFNTTAIKLPNGQGTSLQCGFEGVIRSCQWENAGVIYKVADIINGSYPNIRVARNTTDNQCGIDIASMTTDNAGYWDCKVYTYRQTLRASRRIYIESPCTNGFVLLGFECFLAVNKRKSWHSAREYCQSMDGDLAVPRDLTALSSYVKQKRWIKNWVWLGGNSSYSEPQGSWFWLNGTEITEGWSGGAPNTDDYGKNCLRFYAPYDPNSLYNEGCSAGLQFICEQH